MKSIVIIAAFAAAFAAQSAAAQSLSERDRIIINLTDSRDMSTGLAKNAPIIAHQQTTPARGNSERDRIINRLTDSRDMSTGFQR